MTLNSVDLPQPDGPITDRNSPGRTSNETSSTAVSTPSGVEKRIEMSSTRMMASVGSGPCRAVEGWTSLDHAFRLARGCSFGSHSALRVSAAVIAGV